jgi:hypothetical protein
MTVAALISESEQTASSATAAAWQEKDLDDLIIILMGFVVNLMNEWLFSKRIL